MAAPNSVCPYGVLQDGDEPHGELATAQYSVDVSHLPRLLRTRTSTDPIGEPKKVIRGAQINRKEMCSFKKERNSRFSRVQELANVALSRRSADCRPFGFRIPLRRRMSFASVSALACSRVRPRRSASLTSSTVSFLGRRRSLVEPDAFSLSMRSQRASTSS